MYKYAAVVIYVQQYLYIYSSIYIYATVFINIQQYLYIFNSTYKYSAVFIYIQQYMPRAGGSYFDLVRQKLHYKFLFLCEL